MKGDGTGEKRVRRMKEKEGLKSREARKDCEKENETREQPAVVAIVSVTSATMTFEYLNDRETRKE